MFLGVTKGPPKTLIYILTYKERLQLADTFPNRIWSFCPLADLNSSNYIHFEKYILFLSDLYIQRGARTHNPELRSRTLFQQSRPGTPVITYFELSVISNHSFFNKYLFFVSDTGAGSGRGE